MPGIGVPKTRSEKRFRRHLRVRNKITGTAERPRLVVFRSLKHIYAQLVDDTANRTFATVSDLGIEPGGGKKGERAAEVGKLIAERAKTAGITRVVFDRAGYRYHGRIKAVADGARKGGLEF
jgi:large subunit ribosomal protein L18